jgi:Smr domain
VGRNESRTLDLHGFGASEALAQFVEFYNGCVRSGYRGAIEVIHGYGSTGAGGVIQKELRKFLSANSGCLEMLILGESVGNPGLTKVFPMKLLPARGAGSGPNAVRNAILKFCEAPKAEERIFTKLRGRFGDRMLREELDRLHKDGLLREIDGKLERL